MKPSHKGFLLGCGTGIIATIATLVAIVAGVSLLFREQIIQGMAERLSSPPIPADPAMDFDWSVRTLDGTEVPMSCFVGKTLFISIWSPDCAFCLAELAGIQRLSEKTTGVQFIGLSTSDGESLQESITKYGITFPVYILPGERPPMFVAASLPATFVISPKGAVTFQHVGAVNYDDARFTLFLQGLALSGTGD